MIDLQKAYTPKQIEILKACRDTDWFMLINHGAKRSGKTQLDNDLIFARTYTQSGKLQITGN